MMLGQNWLSIWKENISSLAHIIHKKLSIVYKHELKMDQRLNVKAKIIRLLGESIGRYS